MPSGTSDYIEIANLLFNAGGLIVFLALLLTGQVFTRHAIDKVLAERDLLISEKDSRISERDERIESLQAKLDEVTDALKESVDANKRLAEIEAIKLRLGLQ